MNLHRWIANRIRCRPLIDVPESVQESLDRRACNLADSIDRERDADPQALVEALAYTLCAGFLAERRVATPPKA